VSSVDPVLRVLADLDRPARPTVEFQDALRARLLGELKDAIGHEPEAQESARSNGRGARVLRAMRRRPGRAMLAFAAVAGAVAAALFVSSPWKTAPGFLEQVQAALTPPPGRILHVKWDHIFTSEDPACTSTLSHEFWIDTTPPHRYRAIVPLPADPGSADPYGLLPCPSSTPAEVGGDLGKPNLRFVPPNRLVRDRALYFSSVDQDPWAFVREMISEGRAHREGTVQLDGRTVERVRFDPDPPASCQAPGHCPTEPSYGYFDPETLELVAWDYARDPTRPGIRGRERYQAYEYLPRTDDNLALTDIRAQHPDAIGP
jgi:hypothetical protein